MLYHPEIFCTMAQHAGVCVPVKFVAGESRAHQGQNRHTALAASGWLQLIVYTQRVLVTVLAILTANSSGGAHGKQAFQPIKELIATGIDQSLAPQIDWVLSIHVSVMYQKDIGKKNVPVQKRIKSISTRNLFVQVGSAYLYTDTTPLQGVGWMCACRACSHVDGPRASLFTDLCICTIFTSLLQTQKAT